MHDWTLVSIVFNWKEAQATLNFRCAEGRDALLTAHEVLELQIPRHSEWGPSVSVNEVGVSMYGRNDFRVLKIEMQTGDVISIVARHFDMPIGD